MSKIIIVDYGLANLRSVQKALEHVGAAADITSDPQRVAEADKVILPGVGASATPSPVCATPSSTSRSWRTSARASRSSASAWDCNC